MPIGQLTEQVELQAMRAATADLAPGERLLDLGCGTGSFALDAARRGARVTGVDQAPAMVAASRAKARAAGIAADFRVADAGALPCPSRSFQWVTALLVLEFARDPSSVLQEAARVLTPDGRLVIAALNRWSLWTLARRLRGMFHPTIYRQARFLSRARLDRRLRAAGFSPQTWWGAVYYPPVYHPRLAAPYLGWEGWGRRRLPGASAYLVIRAQPRQTAARRSHLCRAGREGPAREGCYAFICSPAPASGSRSRRRRMELPTTSRLLTDMLRAASCGGIRPAMAKGSATALKAKA